MFKKAFGPKKSFTKKPFDNTIHQATCSGCGKDCEVPFKPNGKKPVFCSACYIREEKPDKFSKRPSEGRRDGSDFYEKKSAYKSRPHARPDSRPSTGGVGNDQLKSLEAKLDTIIDLLRSKQ